MQKVYSCGQKKPYSKEYSIFIIRIIFMTPVWVREGETRQEVAGLPRVNCGSQPEPEPRFFTGGNEPFSPYKMPSDHVSFDFNGI